MLIFSLHKIIDFKKQDLLADLKIVIASKCVTGTDYFVHALSNHFISFMHIGTLSADGWSAHSQSYFALLLHYLDNETLLPVTILLGTVKKSKQNAQSLLEETRRILTEWDLEKQLELPFEERFAF